MTTGGIDIGSRYIKYVILEDNKPLKFHKMKTGHDPLTSCNQLIGADKPDRLIATGYGRYLLEIHDNVKTITEIKAVARGAKDIFPTCRTIIDIGGQDTKVISLNQDGDVTSFEMNDRCAAGTGKFLEVMANALNYAIHEFGHQCHGKSDKIVINNMCTVFAESEVIGLITRGVKREEIAKALHVSIVNRVIGMLKRIDVTTDLVFTGGCAYNNCLKNMFKDRLQIEILVNENPDILAAYGAALLCSE
ncbi:MAG: hypothetical protein HQK91_01120 [Nitrospirae bacterium]|nr:hypothetical protein [Nitrospirota bacterium]